MRPDERCSRPYRFGRALGVGLSGAIIVAGAALAIALAGLLLAGTVELVARILETIV